VSGILNLASLVVVVALSGGILWGVKVGFFEALVRLMGVLASGMISMSCLGTLGGILSGLLSDEYLGFAAAWIASFCLSNIVFWVVGNLFFQRGKVAFYGVLDRTLGVVLSVALVLLLLSGVFIGIFLSPFGTTFIEATMPGGFVLCGADRRMADVYAKWSSMLDSKDSHFRPEEFMNAVKTDRRTPEIEDEDETTDSGNP